jgi:hypothetical protein
MLPGATNLADRFSLYVRTGINTSAVGPVSSAATTAAVAANFITAPQSVQLSGTVQSTINISL